MAERITTGQDCATGSPKDEGELAGLIRSYDWARTPLGAIEAWPQSLRAVVDRLLRSQTPIYMCWGTSFTSIYNDAFAPFLGGKHPEALGQPYTHVSAAFWLEERPLIGAVMAGHPQYIENMIVHTPARAERMAGRFTFFLEPLRDETGNVAGFFAEVAELCDAA